MQKNHKIANICKNQKKKLDYKPIIDTKYYDINQFSLPFSPTYEALSDSSRWQPPKSSPQIPGIPYS